jgi:hypothetical protein
MRPQNAKERNIAFIKYILLFIVTTGLIVVAVFFGIRLPFKENAYLRDKIKTMESQINDERRFMSKMQNIKALIDSMQNQNVNIEYVQSLVGSGLVEAQNIIPPGDTTFRKKMYSSLIQTFLDYKSAKHSLIKMKDIKATMDECSKLVDKYKSDMEQTQRDLDICRQLSKH